MDILHVFLESNRSSYAPETFDALAQMCREYDKMDVWASAKFVFLDVSPKTCLERIRERNRTGEDRIDEDYLRRIDENYGAMRKIMKSRTGWLDNSITGEADRVAEELYKI